MFEDGPYLKYIKRQLLKDNYVRLHPVFIPIPMRLTPSSSDLPSISISVPYFLLRPRQSRQLELALLRQSHYDEHVGSHSGFPSVPDVGLIPLLIAITLISRTSFLISVPLLVSTTFLSFIPLSYPHFRSCHLQRPQIPNTHSGSGTSPENQAAHPHALFLSAAPATPRARSPQTWSPR